VGGGLNGPVRRSSHAASYFYTGRSGSSARAFGSDSLVTAGEDSHLHRQEDEEEDEEGEEEEEELLVSDYITEMNNFVRDRGVHFGGTGGGSATGGDDVSLYGTPKEEAGPGPGPANMGGEPKPSFIRNQLQALFQPTDNKLAMKLFGSKKALMKERIRQKAAGHWIIHPCSNFRLVQSQNLIFRLVFICLFIYFIIITYLKK